MTAIGPWSKVKCIYPGPWLMNGVDVEGPSLGSIQTVEEIHTHFGYDFLVLIGWPHQYAMRDFRPLDGDDEIAKLKAIAAKPKQLEWLIIEPEKERV